MFFNRKTNFYLDFLLIIVFFAYLIVPLQSTMKKKDEESGEQKEI